MNNAEQRQTRKMKGRYSYERLGYCTRHLARDCIHRNYCSNHSSGAADSYFSKNKARSIDAFLSRWTKVFAAVFVLFVIALNVLSYFNLLG